MAKAADMPTRFCRFMVDGRSYSGVIRANSVEIVEGDPFVKTISPAEENMVCRTQLSWPYKRTT